jgi:hypothetical protein
MPGIHRRESKGDARQEPVTQSRDVVALVRFDCPADGYTTSVDTGGDLDALIKLRVACDLAITAAHELGNPLPSPLEGQINDLCEAIQVELEARDVRFAHETATPPRPAPPQV